MKTRKVWLSLGAAAVSFPVPLVAPASAHAAVSTRSSETITSSRPTVLNSELAEAHVHTSPAADVAVKNDMGGESGEGSAAKADADARLEPALRFYRDIQLVRGHILVGDELVKSGLWADALPHFLHPVEELYEGLAAPLKSRNAKPFLQQLKVLAQTVKAKNEQAYVAALAALNDKLDLVDASLKTEKTDWMPFAVETALETMRSAIGEYKESIEDGRFAKAVEYQDSRGFVLQADRLLTSVVQPLTAKDSSAAAQLTAVMTELKTAWPTPVPPAAVIHDASKVAADISKLELALGNIK